jgi:hypothetical protein
MRRAQGIAALAVLTLLPISALADEPAVGASPTRAKRVYVEREVVHEPEIRYGLTPDCFDQFGATLLECAPRVYVAPQDLATLNALNTVPSRVVRPYPYLFSW